MATPMFPIKSSQISYIGYDRVTKELFVTFKNDSTYKYEDVPQEVFKKLLGASSVGNYFSTWIKNEYKFTRIK